MTVHLGPGAWCGTSCMGEEQRPENGNKRRKSCSPLVRAPLLKVKGKGG